MLPGRGSYNQDLAGSIHHYLVRTTRFFYILANRKICDKRLQSRYNEITGSNQALEILKRYNFSFAPRIVNILPVALDPSEGY